MAIGFKALSQWLKTLMSHHALSAPDPLEVKRAAIREYVAQKVQQKGQVKLEKWAAQQHRIREELIRLRPDAAKKSKIIKYIF